jgi:hypothetical protein
VIIRTNLKNSLTEQDFALLGKVLKLCSTTRLYMRDNPIGKNLSFECHSISGAIAVILPELTLTHGRYLGLERDPHNTEQLALVSSYHSWLKTPDGAYIDAYAVGVYAYTPILIPTHGPLVSYGAGFYQEDASIVHQIDMDSVQNKIDTLVAIIRNAQAASSF